MWKPRHKSTTRERAQSKIQAQKGQWEDAPQDASAELYLLGKTEVKFYSESCTAASQVSWACIANCSYHPWDRKLLLLLNSLNKSKARWQQCHEIVQAVILIHSTTFMSLVHIKQSKPNTDNYTVKAFSIRNGCWSHLSCLVQIQDTSILMSKVANLWAGHCWIRNHIICDLETTMFFHPALENIKAELKAKDSN